LLCNPPAPPRAPPPKKPLSSEQVEARAKAVWDDRAGCDAGGHRGIPN
jgi:hypothetical protein